MPIPYFKCAYCSRIFDTYEGAAACESGHQFPVAVSIKSHSLKPFPYSVEVTFNNGEKRIYNAENLGG